MAQPTRPTEPSRQRLSTTWVFFLVVSAAGPLASTVGVVPLALVLGNGAGLPVAYIVATLLLLCFAVGYAAISRRVINTGAFYTYIARGIGRPPAIGAAMLAVVAYTINVAGVSAVIGYFVSIIAAEQGAQISWIWGAATALGLAALFGYRSVRLSAKLLGALLVLGVVALLVFDLQVLVAKGFDALPLASFAPRTFLSGSPLLALLFALTCFVGIETAALYSEETDRPERSVPKAIYGAVIGLGLFYTVSAWLLVGSVGSDRVADVAAQRQGNLVFDQVLAYGGDGMQAAVAVLFVAGAFASMLAFHNAAARYLFVLGRDRLLPAQLGRTHAKHRSPYRASLIVSAATVAVVAVAIVLRLDPYVLLGQGAVGLATLGIVSLQAIAAVAIVVFFRRYAHGRYWMTLILPGIGALGLLTGTMYLLLRFTVLIGHDEPGVALVPWVLVAVMVAGIIAGLVIRRRKPARYARLAESRLRPSERSLQRPERWTRRYCLIGAGPAGLAMARRLVEEDVPFDWFERHDDVGGIWHADRPGGPMYDSCVAISSTYTSTFPDFAMPADYPDYPAWWQVRDYLRGYARAYGLYDKVTFNTAVTWVKPEGVGWSATLTTGEFRYYSGVIAAPGTAWHPVAPALPGQEHFRGQIWHSARYRRPSDLAGRRVLVVGAGNSGADIAAEAARHAEAAFWSVRRGHRFVPRHIGGVPTDAVIAGVLDPPDRMTLPPDATELVATLVGDVTPLGLPKPDHGLLAGHPTVNGEVLNLLAHRRLVARPAIASLTPDGVRFVDGREERVDLIILATGYDRRPPFLAPELYSGPDGRPDLYLNLFSRDHDGLTVLGLSDLGEAYFPRLDDMARTAIVDITLRELGGPEWRGWHETKRSDRPDLRGGKRFVDSPRNEFLVDDHAYRVILNDICDRYGYTPSGPPVAPSGLLAGVRAS